MKQTFNAWFHHIGARLPFVAVVALIAACDKVPINGDLDGLWQIMTIQTPDGTRSVKDQRAYVCFQLHLSEWECHTDRYFAHFRHEGDSLFFYDFAWQSLHRSKADNNNWVTDDEMRVEKRFDVWGVHNLDARYRIRQLDAGDMILERADTLLVFRKF